MNNIQMKKYCLSKDTISKKKIRHRIREDTCHIYIQQTRIQKIIF